MVKIPEEGTIAVNQTSPPLYPAQFGSGNSPESEALVLSADAIFWVLSLPTINDWALLQSLLSGVGGEYATMLKFPKLSFPFSQARIYTCVFGKLVIFMTLKLPGPSLSSQSIKVKLPQLPV